MEVVGPREDRGPVRIRLVLDDRVVDAVQAGRHQHAAEAALERDRQRDVRVVEQDRDERRDLPGR